MTEKSFSHFQAQDLEAIERQAHQMRAQFIIDGLRSFRIAIGARLARLTRATRTA